MTTSKNKGSSSGKSTTLVGEGGQAEVQEQGEEAAAVVVMVLPAVAVVVLLLAVPGSNGIEKHAHIAGDPRLTAGSVDLLHGTISVPAAATSMSKSDLRMRI